MEIIDKKKFAIAIFNKDDKIFVMYIAALSIMDSNVNPYSIPKLRYWRLKKLLFHPNTLTILISSF